MGRAHSQGWAPIWGSPPIGKSLIEWLCKQLFYPISITCCCFTSISKEEISPGSSGVPQCTQAQPVLLCEMGLLVQVSQSSSSLHPPAKAKGRSEAGPASVPPQPGWGWTLCSMKEDSLGCSRRDEDTSLSTNPIKLITG